MEVFLKLSVENKSHLWIMRLLYGEMCVYLAANQRVDSLKPHDIYYKIFPWRDYYSIC